MVHWNPSSHGFQASIGTVGAAAGPAAAVSGAVDGAAPDRTPAATATPATPASAAAHETFRFMRTLSFLFLYSGQAAASV